MEEKETNRPQKDKNYTWHLDHPWLTFLGDEDTSSVDEEIRFSLDEIRLA